MRKWCWLSKYLFIAEFLYATAICLIKTSILSLYYRTFPTTFMKISYYVLLAIITAWWLAVILVAFFQCRPLEKIWSPFMESGTCIDTNQYFLGNSISNIVTDILILILPVVSIAKLQMKMLPKLSIIGIFLLGSLYACPLLDFFSYIS